GQERAEITAVAVDLVQLPERPRARQRLGEEPAGEAAQLLVIAGTAQRVPYHVHADVEAARRLPGGMPQVQRHRHDPLRVAWDEMEPGRQVGQRAVVVENSLGGVDAAD